MLGLTFLYHPVANLGSKLEPHLNPTNQKTLGIFFSDDERNYANVTSNSGWGYCEGDCGCKAE